jgi:heterodisulfide reductase subunit A-like polyferredoxin
MQGTGCHTMAFKLSNVLSIVVCLLVAEAALTSATPVSPRSQQCQRTKVLVLGGGMAGVTAAQTLSNNSVDDFLIVEYSTCPFEG